MSAPGTECNTIGCKFITCGLNGIRFDHGSVIDCLFYDIGAGAITFLGANGFCCLVYGCTVDGNAKNTTTGVEFPSGTWGPFVLINTIIYDCITGVSGQANGGNGRFTSRNNLFNNNTTDYATSSYETFIGELTDAPNFNNEVGQDYTLSSGSSAVDAGFDGYEVQGSSQGRDIGFTEIPTSVGGGLLMPNKRGNKQ